MNGPIDNKQEYTTYLSTIKKVKQSRKHKITNSLGVKDGLKYYRNTKPKELKYKLTDSQFYAIIRKTNLLLQDRILQGLDIKFPSKMGKLELRKYDREVKFVDGKLKINLPIDWNKTIKYWYDNEEAHKAKKLLRIEQSEIFTILYNKKKANYNNKIYYKFKVNKQLRVKLQQKVRNNEVDAFSLK